MNRTWLERRLESAREALEAMPIWKQRAMAARLSPTPPSTGAEK